MWRLKQFMPKEQSGLEGRTIDIGNLKVHVRNVIAEGGFSCVYLARDALHSSKQYGLKHIICNDKESLDLVTKEISVMKLLSGHPNVVKLLAYTIMDMGRTKEALLVMEFCEKSLVNVLESRGSGYFEGKQILSIFRDVCNAVFAMHSQSPPIAHRDLKAENLLLGPDGVWKLCDFGSTSTNHKRFESPEEMGIEEDNIRKHTTPAYRAPEMWDLFRRDVISEKVDIWALGCLLFRICYFKSAFDGESKLQVLNGNYRIPELSKYSSSVTNLIRDMLQASPDARPDITQVWFRVNEQLPVELQKSLPDRPPDMHDEGIPNPTHKAANPPMPRRSPPPPPSSRENARNISPPSLTSKSSGDVGPMGAFWSSHHVKDLHIAESEGGPIFDDEATTRSALKHDRESPAFNRNLKNPSPPKEQNTRAHTKDFEINFFSEGANHGPEKTKSSQLFNTFVAEFDTSKLNSSNSNEKSEREEVLEAEVDILKEQLKQVNSEKAEVTSKYEKLSAICRSQRQEIQELKQALNAKTLLPNKDASNQQTSSGSLQSSTPPQREKIEGSVMELQQGLFSKNSPSSDSKKWQAFAEEPKFQPQSRSSVGKSVRTTNGHQNKEASPVSSSLENPWGFGTENFTAVPGSSQISTSQGQGSNSQRFSDGKSATSKKASQPAGWAGF